jgi:hypothetical protein
MRILKIAAPAAFVIAALAVALGVNGVPGAANAAPQASQQTYQAKFECSISPAAADCIAAAGAIPNGRRLRIDSVKARIVVPSRIRAPFEFFVEVGDPAAPGGVRSVKATPAQTGRTEGGFFAIWTVDEKVDGFAYSTGACPAPRFRLSSPEHDPLKLLNGAVQDGVVSGSLVALE